MYKTCYIASSHFCQTVICVCAAKKQNKTKNHYRINVKWLLKASRKYKKQRQEWVSNFLFSFDYSMSYRSYSKNKIFNRKNINFGMCECGVYRYMCMKTLVSNGHEHAYICMQPQNLYQTSSLIFFTEPRACRLQLTYQPAWSRYTLSLPPEC